eukprot:15485365-Alexandrium_andersonii.AAC.1
MSVSQWLQAGFVVPDTAPVSGSSGQFQQFWALRAVSGFARNLPTHARNCPTPLEHMPQAASGRATNA